MRKFTISKGKYQGEYIFYDNEEEFLKEAINKKYWDWIKDNPYDFQVGEYVKVNDGILIPILNISKVKRKDGVDKGLIIRFPNGSASVYKSINGTLKKSNFYGNFTFVDPYSFSKETKNSRTITRINSTAKQLFASLIVNGTHPLKALLIAFPKLKKFSSRKNIYNKLFKLLRDEEILNMIKNSNNEFIDKLLKDPNFSDEAIIEYIKLFMENVRPGTQTHLNSINFILQLTGKLPEHLQKNNKIEDIEHEEIPFEQLPAVNTENS